MPTFITEALRFVSNVQLVKWLLPYNEQHIQRYLPLLWQYGTAQFKLDYACVRQLHDLTRF